MISKDNVEEGVCSAGRDKIEVLVGLFVIFLQPCVRSSRMFIPRSELNI